MTKTVILLTALLLTTACGGGSPTAPTATQPPPPDPTPQTITLTGRLVAVNGGQGLPDVQAALGTQTFVTGGGGQFTASTLPTASLSLSLTGSSIVPRRLQVAMLTTRDVAVDAIATGGLFDLGFYQALVRDRLESPILQPLRRWTTNPNLYLQTGVDARTLDMVEVVARESVSQWTAGKLSVASVERGSGSRAGQAGWLTIAFAADPAHCGLSDVGQSGGTITLYPSTVCGCGGVPVRPRTVRHEVGHAMGFYHVDDSADVMFHVASQCDTPLNAKDVYHAAIAYSRPVGNQNPDEDPTGAVNLAPMRVVER